MLWPNGYKVPCILVTGAFSAGKTRFALDIDPVLQGQGETRTLYVDFEGSAADYENQYSLDRIDVAEFMAQKLKTTWTPAQMWTAIKAEIIGRVKAGRYTVVVFDTFSPAQEGAFEANKSSDTMLSWSNTKRDIENFLVTVGGFVETIIVIVHLRAKKDKSMEKEGKGVETLKQLASFYVYLHRDPHGTVKINGQVYPASPSYPYPSGIILKSRLNRTIDEKDEYGGYKSQPLLPDRIPVCTPAALRSRYMTKEPVQFTPDEVMPDVSPLQDSLSDDEKMVLKQQTVEQELEKARVEFGSKQRQAFREAALALGFKNDLEIGRAMQDSGIGRYDPDQHDAQLSQLADWKAVH